nr:hypothetical protein GCM10025730_52090 [Promicromonospora thailandica]
MTTTIVRGSRRRSSTSAPNPAANRYAPGPAWRAASASAAMTTATTSAIAIARTTSVTRGSTPLVGRASGGAVCSGTPTPYGHRDPEASARGSQGGVAPERHQEMIQGRCGRRVPGGTVEA